MATAPTSTAPTSWVDFADAVLDLAVQRRRALAAAVAATAPDGAPADSGAIDERDSKLAAARRDFRDSLAGDNSFAVIVANALLSDAEAEVFAVALAGEMSQRRQQSLAYIQDDPGKPRLVLQTIGFLLGPDHPGAVTVGYDSGLRRAALIDIDETGPWGQHEVQIPASVIWAFAGDSGTDPVMEWGTRTVDGENTGTSTFVVVTGRDRLRRRQTAMRHAAGTRFIVSAAPESAAAWSALVREATLTGAGIVLESGDSLSADAKRWIDRALHVAWVVSMRSAPDLADLPQRERLEVEAEFSMPSDDEWSDTFGGDQARTHPILPEQLEPVGMAFDAQGRDLDSAVRRLVGSRLEKLARRIRPRLGWDDIVLSPDRLAQLHEIVDTFRNSSMVYDEWGFAPGSNHGLVALFSGPSGAGKTLSAEVLAKELRLDIFKLEMSAVVSKYIGETEKNLEEVFDAASAGNLVLFFDEADALFGKRSEVKDARDRYANIEVSYLLQRLERYEGIVVLATNFEKNLDEAFLRRIHTRIDFVLPGEAERLAIWKLNLPAAAPIGDVDLPALAKNFQLSGASIRNAAVHGAFLASAEGSKIDMRHLVLGVARDYRKFGRLIKPDEFGEFYALVK